MPKERIIKKTYKLPPGNWELEPSCLVSFCNGDTVYYKMVKGKRIIHNPDGPAIEFDNIHKTKEWWFEGHSVFVKTSDSDQIIFFRFDNVVTKMAKPFIFHNIYLLNKNA